MVFQDCTWKYLQLHGVINIRPQIVTNKTVIFINQAYSAQNSHNTVLIMYKAQAFLIIQAYTKDTND